MNLPDVLRFRSLRGMITTLILVVVGSSVALTTFVTMVTSETMVSRAMEARTRLISNLAMQGIREAMLAGTPTRLRGTLERMRSVESVLNIRIVDPSGMVRIDAAGTDSGAHVALAEFMASTNTSGVRFAQRSRNGVPTLEGLLPIPVETECRECHKSAGPVIAYLSVEADMKAVSAQLSDFRAISIGAIVLTLIGVGLALAVILTHTVTAPLKRLEFRMRTSAEYVRSLPQESALDLSGANVPVEVEYEVGRVAESFNELLAALQRAHREIKRLHDSEMEQAGKMATIGELASSIAHEIRNPLAGILGAVEVIAEDLPADHPKRAICDLMKGEIHRLNRTLSNLLSYARPRPLEFRRLRVEPVVQKAMEFVRDRAAGRGVDLQFAADGSVPEVVADEDGLTQVVMNLMLNSIDAMPNGGPLSVHVSSGAERVAIEICDAGEGMPPSVQESLFRPFFTTKAKGTGLGLAISKRIVDSHGGALDVKSRPGIGTTMTIVLPAAGEARVAPLNSSPASMIA